MSRRFRPSSEALTQFMRFLFVGGSATLLQYLLLIVFVQWLFWLPVIASALAYATSTLYNYLANHAFTFNSGRSHRSALPRFIVLALIGLSINTAAMWLIIHQFHGHYLVAQLVATLLALCWNFLASRYWAFAAQPSSIEPQE